MIKLSNNKTLHLHLPEFERVAITLVGCGGTGSHIASGLISIGQALDEKGISLDMLFIDPDIVEETNVGRQLFSLADVGRPKAVVLSERLNSAFAAKIGAARREIDSLDTFRVTDALNIVIGAVDNVEARRRIEHQVIGSGKTDLWWIDAGNDKSSGQVALGCCSSRKMENAIDGLGIVTKLPAPSVVWPDLVSRGKPSPKPSPKGRGMSCAELAAAGEQGLMVNRMVAAWTCALLYDFLIAREVRWFALAFDLLWGGTRPYVLDAKTLADVTGLSVDDLTLKSPKRAARRRR